VDRKQRLLHDILRIDSAARDLAPGKAADERVVPPGSEDKVMHSCLKIGDSEVMASDGTCGGQESFKGFSLSLNARDAAEADRLFAALAEGGQVQMPLAKTFFSPRFGMVADRFGVSWMVVVAAEASAQRAA
jgi:PhnB protein